MTRINVVPVQELSDQWLRAEYRELPRCILQNINTDGAPKKYKFGSGHMKWAKNHTLFLVEIFFDLVSEIKFRGFTANYNPDELASYAWDTTLKKDYNYYQTDDQDIRLNRGRLIERYAAKPNFYRWTNRTKPDYLKIVDDVKNSTFKFLNGNH